MFSKDDPAQKLHLPRLPPEFYQGLAIVHWTLNIEGRSTGWLTPAFHQLFCAILLHTCARYSLAAAAYVLMPDHMHLLWIGLSDRSDQRTALEFLRRHLRAALAPAEWQHQAYDHVLRHLEQRRDVVTDTANYILANPEKDKLVSDWRDYPYLGACVPGYPEFDPRQPDFWDRFWRCYDYLLSGRNVAARPQCR